MVTAPKLVRSVPVGRVFLSLTNPRFKPVDAETKAMERLCDKEYVYPLARDIVRHGLNPLEQFAFIPLSNSGSDISNQNYFVAEGNRRVCAVKLLNDPDLAPSSLRANFKKLAQNWTPLKGVNGVVFETIEDVDLWLNRIHKGLQGGIGRKDWD